MEIEYCFTVNVRVAMCAVLVSRAVVSKSKKWCGLGNAARVAGVDS